MSIICNLFNKANFYDTLVFAILLKRYGCTSDQLLSIPSASTLEAETDCKTHKWPIPADTYSVL